MTLTITLENELAKDGELFLRTPRWTDAQLYEFCQQNPLLPIERTAEGDIAVMAPGDDFTDSRNFEFNLDLGIWNRALPTPGIAFGPSAGFTLPNGAVRSPDAAWISAARWNAIPVNLRSPFAHIAPDFVVEILSPSDRRNRAHDKMEEYRANGVRLGWLVDRSNRTVSIYRLGAPMETLSDPTAVSGNPELPGLIVDMARVFQETL